MGRRLRTAAFGAAGLAVLATAGCSNKLSAADFQKELTNNGVPANTAQCVTNELQAKNFNFRKYGELSAQETQQITDAATACALKEAGLNPSTSLTVPGS